MAIKNVTNKKILSNADFAIKKPPQKCEGLCDPDRIRTCDPQLRRLLLYPAELLDPVDLRFTMSDFIFTIYYRNNDFINRLQK